MTFPQIRHRRLAGSKGFLDPGLLLPGSAETPAASPLLLDTYPGAAAAYSLRKLRSAYSGAAIRVRRSSDNAEEDIGFDANGDLDTAALLAHVGAGDGFVAKWYNQGLIGASEDQIQSTASAQPKVVSNGSLVSLGTAPAILFDLSSDTVSVSSFIKDESDTFFVVADIGTSVIGSIASAFMSGNAYVGTWWNGATGGLSNSVGTPTVYINGEEFSGDRGEMYMAMSGGIKLVSAIEVDLTISADWDSGWSHGYRDGAAWRPQYLLEVIRWGGDASDDRSAIDSVIKSAYGIS